MSDFVGVLFGWYGGLVWLILGAVLWLVRGKPSAICALRGLSWLSLSTHSLRAEALNLIPPHKHKHLHLHSSSQDPTENNVASH